MILLLAGAFKHLSGPGVFSLWCHVFVIYLGIITLSLENYSPFSMDNSSRYAQYFLKWAEIAFVFQAIWSRSFLVELKVQDLMRCLGWGCPVLHQRITPSRPPVGSTNLLWVRDWVLTLGQWEAFQFHVCTWLSCHTLVSCAAFAEIVGVQL